MEREVACGGRAVTEAKTGFLHLQELCVQSRICSTREDMLELLSCTCVDCTDPNEK